MGLTRRDGMPRERRMSSLARPLGLPLAFIAVFSASGVTFPHAAAEGANQALQEDILAGAFDAVAGGPYAEWGFKIIRSMEVTPESPEVLDERLRAVEAKVKEIDQRLKLVESRLNQLQDKLVKVANINRLREIQRIRGQIEEINFALQSHPADSAQKAILEFRAHQQVDQLKNNVDFDIWKWSDIDPETRLIRDRFHVFPSFELYGVAIITWFSTLELTSGEQPQRLVRESGPALREHAAFLRVRNGWHALRTNLPPELTEPVTLREHLDTAAFCRLEPLDKFADNAGNCEFAERCFDTMADKDAETGRITLHMEPPAVGSMLCTWDPNQPRFFDGEDELRASYGATLMTALADALDRLASTGSLRTQFIGQFPNFVHTAIFSNALDSPLKAPRGAGLGTTPAFPSCVLFNGCEIGPDSSDAHWKVAGSFAEGIVTVQHDGSGLCLDIKDNAPSDGASLVLWSCNDSQTQQWKKVLTNQGYILASGGLCATVQFPQGGGVFARLEVSTRLSLQQCDGGKLQVFSAFGSKPPVGPN